jgi:hypothetical protein
MCTINLTLLGQPPVHQVIDRFEVAVDRVAPPITLAVVPGVVDPLQVSFERFFGVENCIRSPALFTGSYVE